MQDKIRKIRYEIISSCFGSHDGETFLFAFLDHLQLFFQSKKPLVYLLWDENKCIYSSFRDLYYTSERFINLRQENLTRPEINKTISLLENENYFLTIHYVKTDKLELVKNDPLYRMENNKIQETIFPIAEDLIEPAKDLLISENFGTRLSDFPSYVELLKYTFKLERQKYPESVLQEDFNDLNYETNVLPLLDSFRNTLDDVFEEISLKNSIFQNESKHSRPNLGNLFCAIRTVTFKDMRFEKFPYTVGLLLSSRQKLAFKKWGNELGGDFTQEKDLLDCLEQPYSKKSRSTADVTFCSGIIDFGRQPSDDVFDQIDKENITEKKRQELEKLIYPIESQKENSTVSLYYVPVHVNGIPWLVFFTFTPHKTNEKVTDDYKWEYNYSFYRQATQKALSILRWRVEECYLEELANIVFKECVSWQNPPSEIIRKVNSGWHIASRVFPFPRFSLCEKGPLVGEEKGNIELLPAIPGKIRDWWVRVDANKTCFGPKQVNWGSVDNEKMLQKLTTKLKMRIELWSDISREESSHSISYSLHLLKTPISALLATANQLSHKNEQIVMSNKIKRLSDMALFAIAITGAGKRKKLLDEMRTNNKADYVKMLKRLISEIIKLLGNTMYLGGDEETENVVKKLLESQIFTFENEWKTFKSEIQYHEIQVEAVLLEALSNSVFELASCLDFYCSIKLLNPVNTNVFLEIVNSTILSVEEIDQSVMRCNSGSADLIGITNLFNSCKALGYEEPRWFRTKDPKGSNAVGVRVEVGKLFN
jgi:hypothetical protein